MGTQGIVRFVGAALLASSLCTFDAAAQQTSWERTEIDDVLGMARWGDINGDGHADVLWNQDWSGMTWYEYPNWTRHDLWSLPHWAAESDDFDAYDVDGDGDQDIVQPEKMNWYWYENPSWEKHLIGNHGHYSKDVEYVDMDGDGKKDLVVKGEGAINVFYQDSLTSWTRSTITMNTGSEGMGQPVDLNGDGFRDIAANGEYYKNPGGTSSQIRKGPWKDVTFDASAPHETMTRTVDVDRDGDFDIVMTGAEGGSMEPSWYENDDGGGFSKHPLKGSQNHTHTLDVGDVDGDGDVDILIGAMGGLLEVFVNDGSQTFVSQAVDQSACYQAMLADFDKDGDLDITTCKNWDAKPLFVYENKTAGQAGPLDHWTYKLVTGSHHRAFGLTFGDVDSDGSADILSGGYWYRNPGEDMTGTWSQGALPSADALAVVDVDGDAFFDILALGSNGTMYWFEAQDAAGTSWTSCPFGEVPGEIDHGISTQGYAVAQIVPGGKPEFVIGDGWTIDVHYWEIPPSNPEAGNWPRTTIAQTTDADHTQGIGVGDIDGDGALDIAGACDSEGVKICWWRNPGDGSGGWQRHVATEAHAPWPDRIVVADLNGDGRVDIAVGDEGPGSKLFWCEQPASATDSGWARHVLLDGPMHSLDVADMDTDGDTDLVTAEHEGSLRVTVWENDGQGNLARNDVDRGKESHLGADVFDADGDGDLDIVSIAWTDSQQIHLWRNDTPARGGR